MYEPYHPINYPFGSYYSVFWLFIANTREFTWKMGIAEWSGYIIPTS
jgi:hypothetical protein